MRSTSSLRSVLCLLSLHGCATTTDIRTTPAQPSDPRSSLLLEASENEVPAPSRLAVEIRDINIVGRTVRLRGRITSPYDQDVDGVIYRLRLASTDGERILRTEYEEIDTIVEPGKVEPFQLELQSMYFATVPRFIVDAIPVRLGGAAFPLPGDWAP